MFSFSENDFVPGFRMKDPKDEAPGFCMSPDASIQNLIDAWTSCVSTLLCSRQLVDSGTSFQREHQSRISVGRPTCSSGSRSNAAITFIALTVFYPCCCW